MPSLCRDCFSIFETVHSAQKEESCPVCGKHRVISHQILDKLSIAHVDCDAFYAAIHKRDDNDLKGKPVIIGGGKRGVVSTACYIARSYGVKSAMPAFMAKKLCPHAVFIQPDIGRYAKVGAEVKAIMREFTPSVLSVSIDEAYLDLSGTERLHNAAPAQSLAKLARRIEDEIGITVSIGLSENRFLAKTASDMDKPRGFFALAKSDVPQVLWPKPIGFLHGIGPASVKKLERHGLYTIEQIAKFDIKKLIEIYGPHAISLQKMANGVDNRGFESETKRKSISTETTFFDDIDNIDSLLPIFKRLCEKVARTARRKNTIARTINLKLKTSKFQSITRQTQVSPPTQTGREIFESLKPILVNEMNKAPFRLIGVGLSDLIEGGETIEQDLLMPKNDKNLKLERALDVLIDKFGEKMVKPRMDRIKREESDD